MAPSFDVSLLCCEEAIGGVWEEEVGSKCDGHQQELHALIPPPLIFPLEDDDAAIALLLEKETLHMPHQDYVKRFQSLELDLGARENAVNWTLKIQAHYNFGPVTAYLSINYIDRFLCVHQLRQGSDWMFQLLSVSCLSLAAKMEETEVPLSLDLQVGELKYIFDPSTIQRMELLILNTLDWRLGSVTPFSYVGYLLYKIGALGPTHVLISRITELILSSCKLLNFLCFRPSAIAIASVFCACQEFLSFQETSYREAVFSAIPANKEMSMECYRLMQKLLVDPFWTSKNRAYSPELAPQSPAGVLDAVCLSRESDRPAESLEFCENMQSDNNPRKRKLVYE